MQINLVCFFHVYLINPVSAGKHIKVRITGLADANTAGEKLPMFLIGKAKNPRCFKNTNFTMKISVAEKNLDGQCII